MTQNTRTMIANFWWVTTALGFTGLGLFDKIVYNAVFFNLPYFLG